MSGFSESQVQWAIDFVMMGKFKQKRADPLGQALRDEIENFVEKVNLEKSVQ